ncbi:uncharacterized protein SPSC_02279 [Sporisorium scitamineum]|uniref:Uncharacterized protein n=1 Tax=Sporisorium scitamineum TaxID=49012 RepID=A0A0F7S4L7_9BASI|nr:hypothetical protein [Sporisorium scitamineum]CDU23650.1 uncharacterized protein SPSC_02279 [Sporisorium scitamineum]
MIGPIRNALLSTLLLASALMPSGVLGSVQHSWMPLDKRAALPDGSECYRNYVTDPQNCPIVNVAFFEDTQCSKPLTLVRTYSRALLKGNEQMIFDGSFSRAVQRPFGSIRVLAAVPGIGIGFAKEPESDTVVQNTAWMSSAQTYEAFKSKACLTFPNLDASQAKIWTAKMDDSFNINGYVWNPNNIPIKNEAIECYPHKSRLAQKHAKRSPSTAANCKPVCLEPASWGGGGVLLMYSSDDCSGDLKGPQAVKTQLYSTVQCTPIDMTNFRSFKAFQPQGANIDPVFSPVYYDIGDNGYHACAQHDVMSRPFKPNECQKVAGNGMFVGVYGVDPNYPPPGPGPHDKVLLRSKGHMLLSPGPKPQPHKSR